MRQFCRRTAPCDSGQMRLTVLDRETQACPLCRITGIRTLPRHKLRNKIGGPGSFRGNRAFFSARATDNSAGRLHAGSQNCPIFHAPPSLFHGGVRLPAPSAHTRFGELFATVCRCAAERNIHATACPVRSRFIGEAIRPAGVAVLSCLEQARRHIRRTGGGGLTGRHAVAGRGYLSRLKS